METNFFQALFDLQVQGDIVITVRRSNENTLWVTVLLNNPACGDDAQKIVPPMNFKGTPAELDEGFFASISAPLQATSQLFVNMESYMKQQEQAALQSKMEKSKTEKVVKEKSEKENKFDAALKKADELEAEGKYREAWMKVPEPTDYPEQADMLRKRRESLSVHFAPSLFND
jgi:PRTRC genetic system protein E